MDLLYWLFRHKNMNPCEVYRASQGELDLLAAFAEYECEQRKAT